MGPYPQVRFFVQCNMKLWNVFYVNGSATKYVEPSSQPLKLSRVSTTAKLQYTGSRTESCTEPTLCTVDNNL